MSRKVFINLPVKDLTAARAFYGALGFTFNEHFSDETAASVVISEEIYVMLLTHPKFESFTDRAILDPAKQIEVLNALSWDSREDVDRAANAALAAGGKEPRPVSDMGFMYLRAIEDLDGHTWEFMWMDPAAVPG